jgi:hydroxymethylglutaryl-CoA lyase
MHPRLEIVEVGPRDGLQNESVCLPVKAKLEFIRRLIAAGHQRIEVGSFVSHAAVPQMAATAELCRRLHKLALVRNKGRCLRLSALVVNRRGTEEAIDCGLRELAVVVAASETFNQKNLRASTKEARRRIQDIIVVAARERLAVRAYVSTAFVCPYEGVVRPAKVTRLARALLDSGVEELSISDTIGAAGPNQVERLIDKIMPVAGKATLAVHFHDTRGLALTNAYVAWKAGVRVFDSSSGGLGGCPFAPGAPGNLATESLLALFAALQARPHIDLSKQQAATRYIRQALRATP